MKIHAICVAIAVPCILGSTVVALANDLTLLGVPDDTTAECGSVPAAADVTVTGGCVTNGELPSAALALYWSFDADQGGGVPDESGNGRTGTVVGATYTTAGKFGGAYRFDGNDWITAGDTLDLAGGTTALTVSVWMKGPPTAGDWDVMVNKQQEQWPYTGWALTVDPAAKGFSQINAAYPQQTYVSSAAAIGDEKWHLVCGVYEVGPSVLRTKLYVDGVLEATDERAGTHATVDTAAPLTVGLRVPNGSIAQGYTGLLDELRIYTRVLSDEEIAALYEGTVVGATVALEETTNGTCPTVLTRVWTATDECANAVSATQTITLVDTTAPVLLNVPGDRTAACTSVPDPAAVTAVDGCDGVVAVVLNQETNGACPAVVTRVWTATDACGNSASATQTVTAIEALPLALLGVPADTTAECGSVPAAADVSATGGCVTNGDLPVTDLALYWSFDADEGSGVSDGSGNGRTGTVVGATYTAAGKSGGAYSFDGNDWITAGDTLDLAGGVTALTVSVWMKGPPTAGDWDVLVNKQRAGWPYTGWALALDPAAKGFGQIIAAYPEQTYLSGATVIGDGAWHLVCGVFEVGGSNLGARIYVDGVLEGTNAWSAVHATVDTAAPLTVGLRVPGGSASQGYTGLLDELRIYTRVLSDEEIVALYDGTVGGPTVTFEESTNGVSPVLLTRVWTATDGCGQSISATQTITLADSLPPVLTGVPADTTGICGFVQGVAPVTAYDACEGTVPVLLMEETNGTCPAVVTRVWTATDSLGHDVSATQTITLVEWPALELVGVPEDTTAECGSVQAAADVTATGGCVTNVELPSADLALYWSFDVDEGGAVSDESGHGRAGTVVGATYTASGKSGGAYSFDGNDWITTGDTLDLAGGVTALTVSVWMKGPPTAGDWDVMVNKQQVGWPYTGWALTVDPAAKGFSQINAAYPQQTYVSGTTTIGDDEWHLVCGVYEVGPSVLRTKVYVDGVLEATDERTGAHASVDTAAPLTVGLRVPGGSASQGYTGLLDELRIYTRILSDEEIATLYEGTAGRGMVMLEETLTGTCPVVLTRVWTATDACANAVSATQTITLVDTTAPVLAGVPADVTTTCGYIPSPAAVVGLDACDGTIPALLTESTNGTCPAVVTRVWTATDACGNSASATQKITAVEAQPLVLVGVPEDTTVECGSLPAAAEVTVTGGCVTNADLPVTGLALYWSFDADEGGRVSDVSGHGRTGTVVGATYSANGKSGGAYSFGGNDWIAAGDTLDLTGGATALTVSVWMKGPPTASDWDVMVNKQQVEWPYTGWALTVDPLAKGFSQIIAEYPQQTYVSGTRLIGDEEWHLVCGVYEVGPNVLRTKIYVDGVLEGTSERAGAHASVDTAAPLTVGLRVPGGSASQGYTGLLDELRIYTRVLSDEEITALYGGTASGPTVTLAETTNGTCPGTVTRVWTAMDGCGNSASATQTITISEVQPLGFAGVPEDTTAECGSVPPPADVTVTGGCGAASSVPVQGLALYWSFDTDEGGGVSDGSGHGRSGTVVGATYTAAGRSGGAYSFDGNDWITAGDTLDLTGGATALTVSVWMKGPPTAGDWDVLVNKQQVGWPYTGWALTVDPAAKGFSQINATYPEQSYVSGTKVIGDEKWHLVCGVYEVGPSMLRTKLYVDGVLETTNERPGVHGAVDTASPLTVGLRVPGGSASQGYTGLLDELRIYTRVLSDEEITALYEGTGSGLTATYQETTNGACPAVLTRVWMATDSCEQSIVATQRITVVDTTAPSFLNVPADGTTTCDAVPDPASVTAVDACDGAVAVVLNQETNGTCPAVVTRVWTATDRCGNSASVTQMITLTEGAPLELVGVPEDTTVACGSVPDPAAVTATGGCTVGVSAPTAGLALYWSFDTDEGGGVSDQSGNGRTGTVVGATFTASGKSGGAYSFDGNDWITAGDTLDLAGDVTALTVCVWMKGPPTASDWDVMVNKQQVESPYTGWALTVDPAAKGFSQINAAYPEQTYVSGTTTIGDQAWHLVCGVYEVGPSLLRTKLYVDGVMEAADVSTGVHASVDTAAPLTVGLRVPGGSASQGYTGLLDELRIYTRALSDAELAGIYSGGGVSVSSHETTSGTCPLLLHRVWTAVDGCENSVSATQTITVTMTSPPVLVGVPADTTVACGLVPPVANVTVVDTCEGSVQLTLAQGTNGTCPAVVTRIWTATDGCGNSASATQIIAVVDGSPSNGPSSLLVSRNAAPPRPLAGTVVLQQGLYRIGGTALRKAGIDPRSINPAMLQVRLNGKEVAAHATTRANVLEDDDAIFFYVPGSASGQSLEVVTGGAGLRMEEVFVGLADGAGSAWYGVAGEDGMLSFLTSQDILRYLLMGFTQEPVWTLDVTDPARPKLLYGYAPLTVGGDIAVYLSYVTPDPANCLAIGANAVIDIQDLVKR